MTMILKQLINIWIQARTKAARIADGHRFSFCSKAIRTMFDQRCLPMTLFLTLDNRHPLTFDAKCYSNLNDKSLI